MSTFTPSQSQVVAVVEDDHAVRKALGRLIQAGGFQPALFESAEAYVEASLRPLCVVLDVNLRGMSGLEFQQRLRAAGDPTSVIIITALDDTNIRAGAEQNGCAGFFLKPVDGNALIDTIETLGIAAVR